LIIWRAVVLAPVVDSCSFGKGCTGSSCAHVFGIEFKIFRPNKFDPKNY
jgi:hypothetical protein